MRLNCQVAVQIYSSTQGVVSRRKATQGNLSVGRKPGRSSATSFEHDNTSFLLFCSANNMSGTKYKIFGNIANIFGKFVKDGKATIRFKQPTHELCLSKADPRQLYKFLTSLKVLTKDNENFKLPILTAAKPSDVKKVKTHLMIVDKKEYIKTASSFPGSLQKLDAIKCNLVRFDMRILALRQLVELNLSQNKLTELDCSLERLQLLRTLNLSSNLLTWFPSRICRSSKLVTLDLSHNKLTCLPIAFGAMKSLVNVKLNDNRLRSLPCNLPQMTNLQSLNVSNNALVVFNWPVLYGGRLNTLDISGNQFLPLDECHERYNVTLDGSFQEYAGKVIKNTKLHYNQQMVGRFLCDFLDSAKVCHICQKYCFGCTYVINMVDPTRISWQVQSYGEIFIPVEMYFCSPSCVNYYDSLNPPNEEDF